MFSDDAPISLLKKKKKPKYLNKKCVVEGIKFDSEKEARRWILLRALEDQGYISELKRQVPIKIEINGKKICKWMADFVYRKDGHPIHEDVKSEGTRKNPVYILKKKLVFALHGIQIVEVVDL